MWLVWVFWDRLLLNLCDGLGLKHEIGGFELMQCDVLNFCLESIISYCYFYVLIQFSFQ